MQGYCLHACDEHLEAVDGEGAVATTDRGQQRRVQDGLQE
jgi:hypothetical protein